MLQFQPSLDDWIPANDLARVGANEVDRLDLSGLTGTYAWFWDGGEEPCGHPELRLLTSRQDSHTGFKIHLGLGSIGCPHRGGDAWRHEPVAASADSRAGQSEAEQEGLGEEIQAALAGTGRANEPVWKA